MAKSTKRTKLTQAQKSDLGRLKKKGLYAPKEKKAAPTKYSKSLLRKFADVLAGRASVVKVDRKTASKFKSEENIGVRSRKGKLIVPTRGGERASFSKKKGRVQISQKFGGERYVREPLPPIHDPLQIKLKPGERVSIATLRRGGKIEYLNLSEDDFRDFWASYGPKATKREFKNLGDYLFKFRHETVKGKIVEDDDEENE